MKEKEKIREKEEEWNERNKRTTTVQQLIIENIEM